jgi:thiamine-monophosphate kinase
VNNNLGDSAAGLKVLTENVDQEKNENAENLVHAHNHPQIFLREGFWLGQQPLVHAMMDVSDGLHSDIKHILKQSKAGARIELEKLPVSDSLKNVSSMLNWNSQELAANGGEDYCLLFTVNPGSFENLANSYKKQFKTQIYPIGEITSRSGLSYYQDRKQVKLAGKGFKHF